MFCVYFLLRVLFTASSIDVNLHLLRWSGNLDTGAQSARPLSLSTRLANMSLGSAYLVTPSLDFSLSCQLSFQGNNHSFTNSYFMCILNNSTCDNNKNLALAYLDSTQPSLKIDPSASGQVKGRDEHGGAVPSCELVQ